MRTLKFAENLKNAMQEAGINQRQLAEKLGTTQQTISRWLSQRHEPDFETLLKICEFFDESPNSLLGYDNN